MIGPGRQPDAAEQPDLSNPESGAAHWDARLRSPECTDSERAEFTRWRNADPANRTAFEQLQGVLHQLREARHRPEVRSIRDFALGQAQPRRSWVLGRAAAIVALACGIGLAGYWIERLNPSALTFFFASEPAGPQTFATAVGERSTVTLNDGSTVILNTQSRITVDYNEFQRRVTLLAGQALFEVAKDSRRPFVVYAGNQRITATGTAFDVRLDAEEVRVTLVEGRVAVDAAVQDLRPPALTAQPARTSARTELKPGEQLVVSAGTVEPEVRVANVAHVTSWREGRVVFEDAPLSEAVAEINRYSTTQVVLPDAAMGELRVNGMFRTGQVSTFVNALREYFPIEAQSAADEKILLEWRH